MVGEREAVHVERYAFCEFLSCVCEVHLQEHSLVIVYLL